MHGLERLLERVGLEMIAEGVKSQGRSNGGGGISVYIPPPKSVYLTNFYVVTGCFFLFDPGQIVVDFEIGMTC